MKETFRCKSIYRHTHTHTHTYIYIYVRKINLSIWAMLETTAFKKRIPKVNFLRAVSVKMKVKEAKKENEKTSLTPKIFVFYPPLPFWLSSLIFLKTMCYP